MFKSKRFWSIIMLAVLVFALGACGKKEDSKDVSGNDVEKTVTGAGKTAIAKEDFKVAVIHIGNPADGAGYSYAHDLGIIDMQEALGLADNQIIRKK